MADNHDEIVLESNTDTTPVQETNTPAATTPTETNLQNTAAPNDAIAIEFDIDVDALTKLEAGKAKIPVSKFKEVDDDLYDGDDDWELDETTASRVNKLLERTSEYKKKANEYKTVAEASEIIKNDPHIKQLREAFDLEDTELIKAIRVNKYKQAGASEDEAIEKAEEYLAELSEKVIKTQADDIRLDIRGSVNARAKEIQSKIAETSKALSLSSAPNPDLVDKAVKHLSKTEEFLGLKIGGKTETGKKDFMRPVEKMIKDGSLIKELQSNPELLVKAGLLHVYGDKFTSAVQSRTPSRKKQAEAMEKAPHSNGPKPVQKTPVAPQEGGLKDPRSFK